MRGRAVWLWVAAALVITLLAPAGVVAVPGGDEPLASAGGGTVAVGYQGVLSDRLGQPLTGLFPMQFALYSARTSGSRLWESGPLEVAAAQGTFEVTLNVAQSLLDGRSLWLAVYVDGETLTPRQEILAVPYAAGLLPNVSVRGASGDILAATHSGVGSALWGSSPRGTGVYGTSDSGRAVFGENVGATQGQGYGGYFTSTSGVGVYGESSAEATASAAAATGVRGYSLNGHGMYGETASAARAGVAGASANGYGVRGESTNGVALAGLSANGLALRAQAVSGVGAEVHSEEGQGLLASSGGQDATDHAAEFRAVAGHALRAESGANAAVWAESGSVTGVPDFSGRGALVGRGEALGVYGASATGSGVEGASVNGVAVRGTSAKNYAGYFVSSGERALYAASLDGRHYDAYFGGELGIEVAGSAHIHEDVVVDGDVWIAGTLQVAGGRSGYSLTVARNLGTEELRRGELVEVVGMDPAEPGQPVVPGVRRTQGAASLAVLGVVDCAYDPVQGFLSDDETPIPVGGYVGIVTQGAYRTVRAETLEGAIAPGDLLASGALPGHVMRAGAPQVGTVVGKALESLTTRTGTIAVFVTLE
ncbi:MAG: hypothetical protein GX657_09675 [Chloroflexi bacterium]|nr:hypothetical protein [Chloroflexota bacterium]